MGSTAAAADQPPEGETRGRLKAQKSSSAIFPEWTRGIRKKSTTALAQMRASRRASDVSTSSTIAASSVCLSSGSFRLVKRGNNQFAEFSDELLLSDPALKPDDSTSRCLDEDDVEVSEMFDFGENSELEEGSDQFIMNRQQSISSLVIRRASDSSLAMTQLDFANAQAQSPSYSELRKRCAETPTCENGRLETTSAEPPTIAVEPSPAAVTPQAGGSGASETAATKISEELCRGVPCGVPSKEGPAPAATSRQKQDDAATVAASSSRIPAELQAVFIAAAKGALIDVPPPNGLPVASQIIAPSSESTAMEAESSNRFRTVAVADPSGKESSERRRRKSGSSGNDDDVNCTSPVKERSERRRSRRCSGDGSSRSATSQDHTDTADSSSRRSERRADGSRRRGTGNDKESRTTPVSPPRPKDRGGGRQSRSSGGSRSPKPGSPRKTPSVRNLDHATKDLSPRGRREYGQEAHSSPTKSASSRSQRKSSERKSVSEGQTSPRRKADRRRAEKSRGLSSGDESVCSSARPSRKEKTTSRKNRVSPQQRRSRTEKGSGERGRPKSQRSRLAYSASVTNDAQAPGVEFCMDDDFDLVSVSKPVGRKTRGSSLGATLRSRGLLRGGETERTPSLSGFLDDAADRCPRKMGRDDIKSVAGYPTGRGGTTRRSSPRGSLRRSVSSRSLQGGSFDAEDVHPAALLRTYSFGQDRGARDRTDSSAKLSSSEAMVSTFVVQSQAETQLATSGHAGGTNVAARGA